MTLIPPPVESPPSGSPVARSGLVRILRLLCENRSSEMWVRHSAAFESIKVVPWPLEPVPSLSMGENMFWLVLATPHPRLQIDARISDDWQASLIFASMPTGPEPLEAMDGETVNALAAALNEMDAFPVLMYR